ncbi:MAG: hypothetical protein AUK32_00540 [Candidatus Aquicultor secundus]|nr:MAG: hypothetical protein AUK32_00540 [Candidatus Aquicultor secundus]PIX52145.1 MAG: hypothetical protein COZ51_05685 [Candidatus Aquicultor secundus]
MVRSYVDDDTKEEYMLKKTIRYLLLTVSILLMFNSSALASQTKTWSQQGLPQQSSYNNFFLYTTLPTLNSVWANGTENKINWEYWFTINNDTSQWVEMGFHSGYGFNSDGTPNYTYPYTGLFTARATSSSFSLTPFQSRGWAAGQNHSMGVDLRTGSAAQMRTDGSVLGSYLNSTPSNVGRIDAGVEWGTSNNAAQSISTPSYMTDLNVMYSGTWHFWKDIGGIVGYNSHAGYAAIFESSYNRIKVY